MTSCHCCSLFVEGEGVAIQQFRDSFTAAEFAADSNAVYRDRVGEGNTILYSFRTGTAPSIEQFSLLAARWPTLKLNLIHERSAPDAFVAFACSDRGCLIGYWGSALTDADHGNGIAEISRHYERYRKYRLSTEQFEKRLRAYGIRPDDPIEPPDYSDAADW